MASGWLSMGPGRFGTYMCYVLLVVSVFVSIMIQQFMAESVSDWVTGCEGDYKEQCIKNSAVFRFAMAMTILYGINGIGTYFYTPFYDNMWWGKFLGYTIMLIGFGFMDSKTFDANGYAWFARIAGFFFVILQQIILLDIAYVWNERWVAFATRDEESGNLYLYGLLFFSAALYSMAFIGMVMMFIHFDCKDTSVIISLTLVLTIIASFIQIFATDHGSLLTSAIMTAYATYICFSAVSLYPDDECNPTIGDDSQVVTQVVGTALVIISLTWTTNSTISKAAHYREADGGRTTNEDTTMNVRSKPNTDPETTSDDNNGSFDALDGGDADEANKGYTEKIKGLLVEVSFIFLLISCYYAMVITNWATEQEDDGSVASPSAGHVAMWLQSSAIFIAITLYIWSLVAPSLYPDRDFSGIGM